MWSSVKAGKAWPQDCEAAAYTASSSSGSGEMEPVLWIFLLFICWDPSQWMVPPIFRIGLPYCFKCFWQQSSYKRVSMVISPIKLPMKTNHHSCIPYRLDSCAHELLCMSSIQRYTANISLRKERAGVMARKEQSRARLETSRANRKPQAACVAAGADVEPSKLQ